MTKKTLNEGPRWKAVKYAARNAAAGFPDAHAELAGASGIVGGLYAAASGHDPVQGATLGAGVLAPGIMTAAAIKDYREARKIQKAAKKGDEISKLQAKVDELDENTDVKERFKNILKLKRAEKEEKEEKKSSVNNKERYKKSFQKAGILKDA